VRDFVTNARVTSQVLQFDVVNDGQVVADNETRYELDDFLGDSETEYECDECGLPLDKYKLPTMVVEEE
jgi:hypothetical protein